MATDIPVLVPWRTDNGPREKVWDTLKPSWIEHHRVIEGSGPTSGPFNRSAALNQAANDAGDWDLAILADADSWVPRYVVEQAFLMARHSGRLVFAHNGVWQSVDAEWKPVGKPVRGAASSILVIDRELWERVGGFDERFVGYGYEDRAFAHACLVAGGKPLRVEDPNAWVRHLDHESRDTFTELRQAQDVQLEANRALASRYLNCPDIEALNALIAERV